MKDTWRYRRNSDQVISAPGQVFVTPSGNIVTRCPCGEEQLNLNADHGPSFAPDGTMILTSSIQLETRGRFNSELLCHFLVQNGRPIFCSDATCPGGRTEAGVRCEEESE